MTTDATAPTPRSAPSGGEPIYYATGRRKRSVARVRLRRGTGEIRVNERPYKEFFPVEMRWREAISPFLQTQTLGQFDAWVNVSGGGITGQAGAMSLGVARALRAYDLNFDKPLRENGLLTRDSRMTERKKYGQKGARRRFQFSKR
jgi:small subunit ribosomal protein S9